MTWVRRHCVLCWTDAELCFDCECHLPVVSTENEQRLIPLHRQENGNGPGGATNTVAPGPNPCEGGAMKSISQELAERLAPTIMRSVLVDDQGCWIRTKSVNKFTGYTNIVAVDGGQRSYYYAHRVIYVLHKGLIPEGLTIDHLCKVHACCNPEHLEAVTHRVNVLRSDNAAAINARKMTCKEGHQLVPHSTRRKRTCVECHQKSTRAAKSPKPSKYPPRNADGSLSDSDPRHGTTNGYFNQGCRCADCKAAANALYLRKKASLNGEVT